jgi:hypothetical protein
MNPVWDTGKQQFSCVAPSGSVGISHDDTVAPKGNKEFCSTARENLLKACPASDEGKTCKNKAKSIFNACYKDFNLAAVKDSCVASAHRLRNLKIAWIFQIERNGPIVCEGFDHRYLQGNF